MKTMGLIGGMSWESSAEYYRLINLLVKERLGGHANAKSLLLTVNFADIEVLQRHQNWNQLAKEMRTAAGQLQAAGADFLILCTNTMHKGAPEIQSAVSIPLLHITDPTAEAIKAEGLTTVGLLGTRFTMEDDFYCRLLRADHNLRVVIPNEIDRHLVHRAIYDELCHRVLREATRSQFNRIISSLVQQGAQGIILGCTELGLLLKAEDSPVPIFDTTQLHARAAVEHALTDARGSLLKTLTVCWQHK
jgi:aspartate racemase